MFWINDKSQNATKIYSVYDKVYKMNIAKTNSTKTQNEPNITKKVHLTDVNGIPPDVGESFVSSLETSIAAGVLYDLNSVSIHNGKSTKNI